MVHVMLTVVLAESVTENVKLKIPFVVGVPESTPVEVLKVRPGGTGESE